MKVAAIQHDIVWEDAAANFAHLDPRIDDAVAAGGELVLLTEMFSTGFSMDAQRTAESMGGASTQFLVDAARRHQVWVGGSIPLRDDGEPRPSNCFVLATPSGEVHRYRKRHPFSYSGEHEHYAAGRDRVTVDIGGLRCALFVCYDLRFADDFWALAEDTDCYLVVANWPASRREHWTTLLRARAIENQAYVVGVNRVGTGGRVEYSGDSRVFGPFGELVASADDGETTMFADLDRDVVQSTRAHYPFLADRRD